MYKIKFHFCWLLHPLFCFDEFGKIFYFDSVFIDEMASSNNIYFNNNSNKRKATFVSRKSNQQELLSRVTSI